MHAVSLGQNNGCSRRQQPNLCWRKADDSSTHPLRKMFPSSSRSVITTMLLFLTRSPSSRVLAFRSSSAGKPASRKSCATSLPAIGNLFEDLQRSFSTAVNPMKTSGNAEPFYTVGITGASGLVGSALCNELLRHHEIINGKPVRIIRFTRGNQAEELRNEEAGVDITLAWNPKGRNPGEIVHPSVYLDTIVHLVRFQCVVTLFSTVE